MTGVAAESPFSLAADEVLVRWEAVGEAPSTAERGALAALLSAAERAHLERFRFEQDAWHYLVAHVLLRRTLAQCAPVPPAAWSFRVAPGGRPEIEGPAFARRLRFSLSHTRGLVACAVCLEHPVGVDVEAVDARTMGERVVARILAPEETGALAGLAAADRRRRLFELWTLKEACLKARGDGLAVPPAAVSFDLADEAPPRVAFAPEAADDPAAWRFHLAAPAPMHVLAMAVRCGAGVDVRFTLPVDAGP